LGLKFGEAQRILSSRAQFLSQISAHNKDALQSVARAQVKAAVADGDNVDFIGIRDECGKARDEDVTAPRGGGLVEKDALLDAHGVALEQCRDLAQALGVGDVVADEVARTRGAAGFGGFWF